MPSKRTPVLDTPLPTQLLQEMWGRPGGPHTHSLAQPRCFPITMATRRPRWPERKELGERSFEASEISNVGMGISSGALRCPHPWQPPHMALLLAPITRERRI